ncbi:MAG: hypothetical protein HeimC3_09800 [Candidatus Heimdallarchaeota archaeon LC_3]|nr:MAG: hypothetical protein HeimC3_09800 [Candidatus Heimdallarchaeota archaeon LC_3]
MSCIEPSIIRSNSSTGIDIINGRVTTTPNTIATIRYLVSSPTFKLNYRSVFLLGLMIFVDISHMYLTFFGDSYILNGEFLRPSPEFNINGIPNDIPINDIFLIFSMVILVYVAINRSLQIKQSTKKTDIFMFSPVFTILLGILFMLTIISFSLTSFIPEIEILMLILFLPLSLVIILVTYAFLQGNTALYTIPVTFYAVIVTEQQSRLVIFSESAEKDSPGEDLLDGLFTALNLSLKETIQSKKELEEISFGDKVVHIVPGKNITSFLITSEKTLMTSTLSKFVTKSFEKQFSEIFSSNDMVGLNTSEFKDFKNQIDIIRSYFAF